MPMGSLLERVRCRFDPLLELKTKCQWVDKEVALRRLHDPIGAFHDMKVVVKSDTKAVSTMSPPICPL